MDDLYRFGHLASGSLDAFAEDAWLNANPHYPAGFNTSPEAWRVRTEQEIAHRVADGRLTAEQTARILAAFRGNPAKEPHP